MSEPHDTTTHESVYADFEEMSNRWEAMLKDTATQLNGAQPAVKAIAGKMEEASKHTKTQVQQLAKVQEDIVGNTFLELQNMRGVALEDAATALDAVAASTDAAEVVLKGSKAFQEEVLANQSKMIAASWSQEQQAAAAGLRSFSEGIAALEATVKLSGENIAANELYKSTHVPMDMLRDEQEKVFRLEEDKAAAVGELEVISEKLAMISTQQQQEEQQVSQFGSPIRSNKSTGFATQDSEEAPAQLGDGCMWAAAVQTAEQTALEKLEAAEEQVNAKDVELDEMKQAVEEAAQQHKQLTADAQRLTFQNGILVQQVTSLLHQHKQELSAETMRELGGPLLPLRRRSLAVFGDCDLPSELEELVGVASNSPAAWNEEDPAARKDYIDLQMCSVDDVAALVQQNATLHKLLWDVTQSFKDGGYSKKDAPAAATRRSTMVRFSTSGAADGGDLSDGAAGRLSITGSASASRQSERLNRLSAPRLSTNVGAKRRRDVDAGRVSRYYTDGPAASRVNNARLAAKGLAVAADSDAPSVAAVETCEVGTMPDGIILLEQQRATASAALDELKALAAHFSEPAYLPSAASEQIISANRTATVALDLNKATAKACAEGSTFTGAAGVLEAQLRAALQRSAHLIADQESLIGNLKSEVVKRDAVIKRAEELVDAKAVVEALNNTANTTTNAAKTVAASVQDATKLITYGQDPLHSTLKEQQQQFDSQWRALTSLLENALSKEDRLLDLIRTQKANADAQNHNGGETLDELRALLARERKELEALQKSHDEAQLRELQTMEQLWQLEEGARALKEQRDELEVMRENGSLVDSSKFVEVTFQVDDLKEELQGRDEQIQTLQQELKATLQTLNETNDHLAKEKNAHTSSVQKMQGKIDCENARMAELNKQLRFTEDELRKVKHDVPILNNRIEEKQRMIDAKQRELDGMGMTVRRLEATFLSRDETRRLIAERFHDDESVIRCTEMLGQVADDNAKLTTQLATAQSEVTRVSSELDEVRRRCVMEQHARQQMEVELTHAHRHIHNADKTAENEAAALRVKCETMQNEICSTRQQRDAAVEREGVLKKQIAVLSSDPVTANTRRFGLSRTENIQQQLEELYGKYEELTGKLAKSEQVMEELNNALLDAQKNETMSKDELEGAKVKLEMESKHQAQMKTRVDALSNDLGTKLKELASLKSDHAALVAKERSTTNAAKVAEEEKEKALSTAATLEQEKNAATSTIEELNGQLGKQMQQIEQSMTEAAELQQKVDARSADRARLIEDNLKLQAETKRLEGLVAELRTAAANATGASGSAGGAAGGRRGAHRPSSGKALTAGLFGR